MLIDLPSFTRVRIPFQTRDGIRLLSSRASFNISRRAATKARVIILLHMRVNAYYRTCNVIYLAINLPVLIYYAKNYLPDSFTPTRRDASGKNDAIPVSRVSRTSKTLDNKFS